MFRSENTTPKISLASSSCDPGLSAGLIRPNSLKGTGPCLFNESVADIIETRRACRSRCQSLE